MQHTGGVCAALREDSSSRIEPSNYYYATMLSHNTDCGLHLKY